MPDASHPIWRIISMAVVGVIVIVMLKFNYANGWAPQDYYTLIAILLGQGLADSLASMLGKKG